MSNFKLSYLGYAIFLPANELRIICRALCFKTRHFRCTLTCKQWLAGIRKNPCFFQRWALHCSFKSWELAILLSALRCRYVVGLKSTKDGFRRKESRYTAQNTWDARILKVRTIVYYTSDDFFVVLIIIVVCPKCFGGVNQIEMILGKKCKMLFTLTLKKLGQICSLYNKEYVCTTKLIRYRCWPPKLQKEAILLSGKWSMKENQPC